MALFHKRDPFFLSQVEMHPFDGDFALCNNFDLENDSYLSVVNIAV
jgi:hypothetical protein